jgi:hypothetical protein
MRRFAILLGGLLVLAGVVCGLAPAWWSGGHESIAAAAAARLEPLPKPVLIASVMG